MLTASDAGFPGGEWGCDRGITQSNQSRVFEVLFRLLYQVLQRSLWKMGTQKAQRIDMMNYRSEELGDKEIDEKVGYQNILWCGSYTEKILMIKQILFSEKSQLVVFIKFLHIATHAHTSYGVVV